MRVSRLRFGLLGLVCNVRVCATRELALRKCVEAPVSHNLTEFGWDALMTAPATVPRPDV